VALALGEDHDLAIASVIAPKGGGADEAQAAAAVDTGAGEDNAAEESDSED
jgi:large subunit ribosomal protein L25